MPVYPILHSGEKIGNLRIFREGLMTVFEAYSKSIDDIFRLYVHGAGRLGYVGLMEPYGEGLHLRRRFTAASIRSFPPIIEFAGMKEENGRKEVVGMSDKVDGLTWVASNDGILYSFDGECSLTAFPCKSRSVPDAYRRIIEGTEYAVFPGIRHDK